MTDVRGERLRLAFAGMHPDRLRQLRSRFGVRGALRYLESKADVSDGIRDALAVDAVQRLSELASAEFSALWRGEPGYPIELGALPDAPDVVFLRGVLPERPLVAIVGTRACTSYGKTVAHDYGRAITSAGWGVVSGLARGIDGAAHRGTVAAEGVGVAVLGCGLDVDYPREHGRLADQLVGLGGGVVSEYPPGTRPDGWRFPPRNRIISGLARAVVIVEAGLKGGALITARYAIEHGRPVFVLPGDITRPSSAGCNLLIKDGAHPVLDPEDLIEELELVLGPASVRGVIDRV